MGLHTHSKETRKHRRYDYLGTVQYCLNPHIDNKILIGAGVDISDSGMSMFSSHPLKEGQDIIIKSYLPVSCQKAKVRWVKKCSANYFKVGLEFTG